MTISVKVHPPFWRLLSVVAVTAVVALALGLVVRLLTRPQSVKVPHGPNEATNPLMRRALEADIPGGPLLLLPVVPMCIDDQEPEANWISAFALATGGDKEVVVHHGRADVVTSEFAFELDWFEKWHEGIGQSLHYATDTGKRPGLALILKASEWPLSAQARSKVAEIDQVASKQEIKLVLLRPQC